MTSTLWRGSRTTRVRIATGLVLFAYALFHFLNIGLGLVSSDLMERAQDWRTLVSRSFPGTIALYGALLIHSGLALVALARRNTLRMTPREALQMVLGLAIPFLLVAHITYTRVAHQVFGVNDEMGYLSGLIFGTPDAWAQSALLLIVWVHGCIGLSGWLSRERWWIRARPLLTALAALIPAFALAGFLTEGRRALARQADPETRAALSDLYNFPDSSTFTRLLRVENTLWWICFALLATALAIYVGRKLLIRRRSVRVRYVDGPEITAPRGLTLLEMSRVGGVPHTAQCGGRGRCTTCRVVVEEGAEDLHAPGETEARSLTAIGAAPGTRLACQVRPQSPLTVYRVFRADGRRQRDHASLGQERRLAVLFLDIRGFTARTAGQLPYDVVFLLNRFFDAIVPAIRDAGGQVDKYLGDGLLAVFEAPSDAGSAQAALGAAVRVGAALDGFNAALAAEGSKALKIGMGLHLGTLVMGEIGAAGNAPRTIIGETVNAASRLEAMTKEDGVEVLVSEAVLTAAGIPTDSLDIRSLTLRGVTQPVPALAMRRATELAALLSPETEQTRPIEAV